MLNIFCLCVKKSLVLIVHFSKQPGVATLISKIAEEKMIFSSFTKKTKLEMGILPLKGDTWSHQYRQMNNPYKKNNKLTLAVFSYVLRKPVTCCVHQQYGIDQWRIQRRAWSTAPRNAKFKTHFSNIFSKTTKISYSSVDSPEYFDVPYEATNTLEEYLFIL